ncbi:MAG: decaprenyl-phosphate phosphoribosyltransferase [Bacteroides sp.]|nr:decaprenyl-phosphate phosphoribosyltransferase [Prevotella sp.]MCM1408255.1 decaprenyl-phosphate phosphoribosyltransferase [Treponema brennaborense]MCM1469579.1 decaprenyl-phosphate phosphoribosyltransferase [Bacteroides sp.]
MKTMTAGFRFCALVRLLRVKHYIKNLLVFLPLVFGSVNFCAELFAKSAAGFFVFCFVSSAVYIVNDIRDAELDRNHPVKCRRPIASGAVPVPLARAVCALLILLSVFCGVFFLPRKLMIFLIPASYLFINLLYSIGHLKDAPIADIAILSAGFLLRLFYGSALTGIPVSSWFYLTVLASSFFFALGKRRNEISLEKNTRAVLKGYSKQFLDKNMYLCAALAIAFYSLWCADPATSEHYGKQLLLSVVLVLLIFLRYSMIVEGESDGDPVEVLTSDAPLVVLCALYAAFLCGIFLIQMK